MSEQPRKPRPPEQVAAEQALHEWFSRWKPGPAEITTIGGVPDPACLEEASARMRRLRSAAEDEKSERRWAELEADPAWLDHVAEMRDRAIDAHRAGETESMDDMFEDGDGETVDVRACLHPHVPTSDAVDILHRRYFEGDPEMAAMLDEERAAPPAGFDGDDDDDEGGGDKNSDDNAGEVTQP